MSKPSPVSKSSSISKPSPVSKSSSMSEPSSISKISSTAVSTSVVEQLSAADSRSSSSLSHNRQLVNVTENETLNTAAKADSKLVASSRLVVIPSSASSISSTCSPSASTSKTFGEVQPSKDSEYLTETTSEKSLFIDEEISDNDSDRLVTNIKDSSASTEGKAVFDAQ